MSDALLILMVMIPFIIRLTIPVNAWPGPISIKMVTPVLARNSIVRIHCTGDAICWASSSRNACALVSGSAWVFLMIGIVAACIGVAGMSDASPIAAGSITGG